MIFCNRHNRLRIFSLNPHKIAKRAHENQFVSKILSRSNLQKKIAAGDTSSVNKNYRDTVSEGEEQKTSCLRPLVFFLS